MQFSEAPGASGAAAWQEGSQPAIKRESPHMTYTSAARLLLARFETYLAGVFHPIPQERVVTGAIQSFYGWFFPFLRNAFICGVLQYLADASGSMTLQVLAIVAYVALAAYCLS
jgi:hypothetical protein